MIYGVVGIVGLGMALASLSVHAYERYPVRADGLRLDASNAYIFVYCNSTSTPIVESSGDIVSGVWSKPDQVAYVIGQYWVVRVAKTSDRRFYRAWNLHRGFILYTEWTGQPVQPTRRTTTPYTCSTYPFTDGVWLREWG